MELCEKFSEVVYVECEYINFPILQVFPDIDGTTFNCGPF